MATDVRIVHTYNVSEDTYWDKLFFDDEYNRRLYLEALKFYDWKVEKQEDKGSEVLRSIDVAPQLGDLPAPIQKVLGDNIRYKEAGVFDKATRRYRITITPSRLADKVKVNGVLYTEPDGERKCRRVFEATVEVKVFGLGGMMEKRFVSDLEKSYGVGAKFTNRYAEEKGL
jgi:hypothetical protein